MKKFIIIIIIIIGQDTCYTQNSIEQLKKGALLVQLPSLNIHQVNYLVNKQDTLKLSLEEQKVFEIGEKIRDAFQKNWSFSKVYFFWEHNTLEIKNKNFNNIMGWDLMPLNEKEKEKIKNNYLTAYIGETQGTLKFTALILSDENLKQLDKPYPRYVRTYEGLSFFKRDLNKTIKILHKKIEWHYSRIQ